MRTEPRIADAGVPDPARDEDADADNNSGGTWDAVIAIVEGPIDEFDWPAADRALDALILGRWPQLMHAYSGCSHAHGSESPPGSGRTGTSLTAADARRRLATDDVWSRLLRCCLLGEGSDHSTPLRLLVLRLGTPRMSSTSSSSSMLPRSGVFGAVTYSDEDKTELWSSLRHPLSFDSRLLPWRSGQSSGK